jgi:heme/copper-type cytochrome/quinol oxidase subunit 2
MSRNEIKIRRQRASATGADRFRNYAAILSRHQRDLRKKRLTRFLWISVVAIIAIIIIVLAVFVVFSKTHQEKNATHSAMYAPGLPSKL